MRIELEIEEDDYPSAKAKLIVSETESPQFLWLEVNGKKWSILTADLIKLLKLLQ